MWREIIAENTHRTVYAIQILYLYFVFMVIKIAWHLHAVIFTQLPHMNEQDIEDMFWNILIVSSAPFESFCRGYRVNSKCNGEWKILVIFLPFSFSLCIWVWKYCSKFWCQIELWLYFYSFPCSFENHICEWFTGFFCQKCGTQN